MHSEFSLLFSGLNIFLLIICNVHQYQYEVLIPINPDPYPHHLTQNPIPKSISEVQIIKHLHCGFSKSLGPASETNTNVKEIEGGATQRRISEETDHLSAMA